MVKLFLDIETLPGDEALRTEIASEITPPANMTKAETIRKWEEEEKAFAVEKRFRDTALQGHRGRILCIGYIKEGADGVQVDVLSGSEEEIITGFWSLSEDVDQFVGHNILDFDLKFIWQRSVILGIRPARELSFARYRSNEIYDSMHEWEKWGGRISLDALCRALRLPSPKGDIDGSKVYDYYLQGRLQEVYEYCLADVRAVKAVYERMNFLF